LSRWLIDGLDLLAAGATEDRLGLFVRFRTMAPGHRGLG
jgi:hypothetical protein